MARISESPANIVDSKIMFGTSNGIDVTHFTNEFTDGLYQKLEFKTNDVFIGIGGDPITGGNNILIKFGYESRTDAMGKTNMIMLNKKARFIL